MTHTASGAAQTLLLALSRETAGAFLKAVYQTGQSVLVFVDGVQAHRGDAVFKRSRIFKTVETRKGRQKTERYNCVVVVTGAALKIVGKDRDYRAETEVAFSSVEEMVYEHGRQSSFMGRMPGIGAFKKPKHWFVVTHMLPEGGQTQTVLLLDPEEAQSLRQAVKEKSGLEVHLFSGAAALGSRSAQAGRSTVVEIGPLPGGDRLPDQLAGKAHPIQALKAATTIRCTLGPGHLVTWPSGALTPGEDSRFDDANPYLIFEGIDLAAQTARLRRASKTTDVRAVLTPAGLTFIEVSERGDALVTTVFAAQGNAAGSFVCVHSRHAGGNGDTQIPAAGQFYGVAEILE